VEARANEGDSNIMLPQNALQADYDLFKVCWIFELDVIFCMYDMPGITPCIGLVDTICSRPSFCLPNIHTFSPYFVVVIQCCIFLPLSTRRVVYLTALIVPFPSGKRLGPGINR
jgi:hypothetical protein